MASQMAKVAQAVENSTKFSFGNSFASTLQAIAKQSQQVQNINSSFASIASLSSLGKQMAEILSKQQKYHAGIVAVAGFSSTNMNELADAFAKLQVHSKLVESIQPKSLESILSFQSDLSRIIANTSQTLAPNTYSTGSAYSLALAVSENIPEAIPINLVTQEDLDEALKEFKDVVAESFKQLSADAQKSYEAGSIDQLLYTLVSGKISKKNFTIVGCFLVLLFTALNDYKDGQQMDRIEQNSIQQIQLEQQTQQESKANYEDLKNELEEANAKVDSLQIEDTKNREAMRELAIKLDSCSLTLQTILTVVNDSEKENSDSEEE